MSPRRSLALVAALSLLVAGCLRPEGQSKDGEGSGGTTALPAPPPDTMPDQARLRPAMGKGEAPLIALLTSAAEACDALLAAAPERHVLCLTGGGSSASLLLRQSLRAARKQVAIAGTSITLLADLEHSGAARALVSQEPKFFSHAAIWGKSAALFSSTFLDHVAAGGAKRLVLTLPGDPASRAPLVEAARRRGLAVQYRADDTVGLPAATLEEVLTWLGEEH